MCGGPGPKAPSPPPLPSSPNEVGISPQLLRPGAWVSPEASPAPCACPSAPAWPVSASRMGFPGRCESCPGATSPQAPRDSVVRNREPPPPHPREATSAAKDSDAGYFCLIIWFPAGDGDSQSGEPARQHGEPWTSCLQKQSRSAEPTPTLGPHHNRVQNRQSAGETLRAAQGSGAFL